MQVGLTRICSAEVDERGFNGDLLTAGLPANTLTLHLICNWDSTHL